MITSRRSINSCDLDGKNQFVSRQLAVQVKMRLLQLTGGLVLCLIVVVIQVSAETAANDCDCAVLCQVSESAQNLENPGSR